MLPISQTGRLRHRKPKQFAQSQSADNEQSQDSNPGNLAPELMTLTRPVAASLTFYQSSCTSLPRYDGLPARTVDCLPAWPSRQVCTVEPFIGFTCTILLVVPLPTSEPLSPLLSSHAALLRLTAFELSLSSSPDRSCSLHFLPALGPPLPVAALQRASGISYQGKFCFSLYILYVDPSSVLGVASIFSPFGA